MAEHLPHADTPPAIASSRPPTWAQRALAQVPQSRRAPLGESWLHYLAWNPDDTGKPGLLFVHGFLAHAHWWDFLAPLFTDRYRVYAMDLSGMGDSGPRTEYAPALHSEDIATVIAHAGIAPAVLVGHSYGGSRVLRAAVDHPELVRHAVVIDSLVRVFDDDHISPRPSRPRNIYPDYASARARYVLHPEQEALAWARDHVARHSLRQVEGGWAWKFDPQLAFGDSERDGADLLRRLRVPLDYVYGEHSRVANAARAQRIGELSPGSRIVRIPGAAHHIMLDQPLALAAALGELLP